MPIYPGRNATIIDSENMLKLQHLLAVTNMDSVYIVGIDKGTYTVNDGTWNINYTGFIGLTVENLPHYIVNLSTGQLYSTTNATLTAAQIQLDSAENAGLIAPATGNLLHIPIIQDVRAYDDSLDLIKISEQSPMDQQVLDETLLSAVTATGASSDVYTLDKKELTICIVASSITDGATFTFQGSPDQTNYGTVASIDTADLVSTTQLIDTDGTFFFEIVNASSLKWFRVNITARTDGTFTVYLTARS